MKTKIAEIYVRLETWWLSIVSRRREEGLESIEWIALAAVVLILIVALGVMMDRVAPDLATKIEEALRDWVGRFKKIKAPKTQ
jgi:hypothetical protein